VSERNKSAKDAPKLQTVVPYPRERLMWGTNSRMAGHDVVHSGHHSICGYCRHSPTPTETMRLAPVGVGLSDR
jgi:hypothetical protein